MEKITRDSNTLLEPYMSVPIWFNKSLGTKFDVDISQAGFDCIKDLFPSNQQTTGSNRLSAYKNRKLLSILDKIPEGWKNLIVSSPVNCVTVSPVKTVVYNGKLTALKKMRGTQIYNVLISNKCRLPAGMLRWREDFELNDEEIKSAFIFARRCSHSTFDHAFQYKINCNILPTRDYLCRYRVVDSNICSKCNLESDTVMNSIYSCAVMVPYIDKVLAFLKSNCNVENVKISINPI